MSSLTANDRIVLIKMASSLPVGDETRKAILAGLVTASNTSAEIRALEMNLGFWEHQLDVGSLQKALRSMSNILRGLNPTSDSNFDRRMTMVAAELLKMSQGDLNLVNLPDGMKPWDFMAKPNRWR